MKQSPRLPIVTIAVFVADTQNFWRLWFNCPGAISILFFLVLHHQLKTLFKDVAKVEPNVSTLARFLEWPPRLPK